MTKQESIRRRYMADALKRLGLTESEVEQLRRISMTLHRWAERECNGEVDVDEATGKAYAVHTFTASRAYQVPNRERGALLRLARIMEPHKRRLYAYHQTDPRGCALYILRRKVVTEKVKQINWESYIGHPWTPAQLFAEAASMIYNRGVAVY